MKIRYVKLFMSYLCMSNFTYSKFIITLLVVPTEYMQLGGAASIVLRRYYILPLPPLLVSFPPCQYCSHYKQDLSELRSSEILQYV